MFFELDSKKLAGFNSVHRLIIIRKHERYQLLAEKNVNALTSEERTEMGALERELSSYGVALKPVQTPNKIDDRTKHQTWHNRPGVKLNEKFDELLGKERFIIFELSRALPLAEAELENYGDNHPSRHNQAIKVEKLREQLRPYLKLKF